MGSLADDLAFRQGKYCARKKALLGDVTLEKAMLVLKSRKNHNFVLSRELSAAGCTKKWFRQYISSLLSTTPDSIGVTAFLSVSYTAAPIEARLWNWNQVTLLKISALFLSVAHSIFYLKDFISPSNLRPDALVASSLGACNE